MASSSVRTEGERPTTKGTRAPGNSTMSRMGMAGRVSVFGTAMGLAGG